MKKLLLITTGGTIASGHSHSGGLAPEKNGSDMLPVLEDVSFDVLDLYAIDSTDVTPEHWRQLYDAVTEKLPDYDGIVILHGTDTMAYTGAVLAFTVNTDKPVILTGSMLPFGVPDSDAPGNIQFAALIAKYGKFTGVHLVFANRVIGGADIVKVNSTDKDAFRRYSGFRPERTVRSLYSGSSAGITGRRRVVGSSPGRDQLPREPSQLRSRVKERVFTSMSTQTDAARRRIRPSLAVSR